MTKKLNIQLSFKSLNLFKMQLDEGFSCSINDKKQVVYIREMSIFWNITSVY